MITLELEALAEIVGGELARPGASQVTGVSIDSRTTMPGDLFVPLPGEHVDGHRFIPDALARGAAGVLCGADHAQHHSDQPGVVVVDDPLDALTGLAAWVRDEVNPLVIAITGSNGKTTTKDLTAAAVGAGRRVVSNPGSFNNEIGLPLTLCLLTSDTQVLVCEIGSRGIGHIADVMGILRPDVAIITTVTGAHLGEFGSLEAIWQAKGELIEALTPDGVAILNRDLDGVDALIARSGGRVVTFGQGAGADIHPDTVDTDGVGRATLWMGEVTLKLPIPGMHNVGNALAALAAAEAVGVSRPIAAAGIAGAAVSRWRMEVSISTTGITVVNDAYNANPQSMKAALDTVAGMDCSGRRWAVLGYMAELGPRERHMHAGVGAHAATAGLHGLIVVDPRAEGIAEGARLAGFAGEVHQVGSAAEVIPLVRTLLAPEDLVLVKGSRSVGLEVVADALLAEGEQP